jgi:uncharacterized protein
VNEDGFVALSGASILANDTDPDAGEVLTITAVSPSEKGANVELSGGNIIYRANADVFDLLAVGEEMTDVFTYTMRDTAGATSTSTITMTITGIADGAVISGVKGAGTLIGTEGEDIITGLNGIDRLEGWGGADQLWGGNGDDQLFGGESIDRLYGENGADRLDGGTGDDILSGGRGSDTFVFKGNFGHDVVTDFRAEDVLEFDRTVFDSYASILAYSQQVGANVVITDSATDTVTLQNVVLSSLQADDFRFV